MNPHTQQLQAVLFLSADPLKRSDICKLLEVTSDQLALAVNALQKHVVNTGLCIIVTQQELQLVTAPTVAALVRRVVAEDGGDLSASSAEVLAIVAYRGPITRVDIDAIRGVDSSRSLRQLLQRSLVTRAKHNAKYTYQVSIDCLRQLGINSLTDLPNYETLSSPAKLQDTLNNT